MATSERGLVWYPSGKRCTARETNLEIHQLKQREQSGSHQPVFDNEDADFLFEYWNSERQAPTYEGSLVSVTNAQGIMRQYRHKSIANPEENHQTEFLGNMTQNPKMYLFSCFNNIFAYEKDEDEVVLVVDFYRISLQRNQWEDWVA
jgi:hypothetical protein